MRADLKDEWHWPLAVMLTLLVLAPLFLWDLLCRLRR